MSATRWLAALFAVTALAAAGCGGDDEADTGGGGGETTTEQAAPTETAAPEGESAGAGKQLFSNACGGCHTLADAGTSGSVGPNLDDMQPDAERVKTAIAEGPGVMPENLFEGAEADQVAEYVASAAGQ